MLYALGPAQIADVHQTIDAILNLDKCAEVGHVADAAFNLSPNRELIMQAVPWIRRQLPHAQRNSALLRKHVEHDALDLIVHIDQLRRMLHPLRPSHLADMDQAFDALLQFHERAVVGHADYASVNMRAHGIAMLSIKPRVRRQLFESQRYALLIFVELQYLDLDLIAHIHQIARMGKTSP